MSLRISFSLTSLIILVGIANVASADNSIFKYDPDKIETGVVYQYVKSNIDGSRHGNVSLFIASKDQLESLKWHQGESEATLASGCTKTTFSAFLSCDPSLGAVEDCGFAC